MAEPLETFELWLTSVELWLGAVENSKRNGIRMKCDTCGRIFTQQKYLQQHQEIHEKEKEHACQFCDKRFYRKLHCLRHQRLHTHFRGGVIPIRQSSFNQRPDSKEYRVHQVATAFKKSTMTFRLLVGKNQPNDLTTTLNSITDAMRGRIERFSVNNSACKINMSLFAIFQQETDPSIVTTTPVVFLTEQFEIYADTDINQILQTCASQLENRIETYEGMGSGWTIKSLYALDTTFWKLDPLRADSYHPMSQWIQNTKCVVNVKNKDNECFRHAVVAGSYKVKHSDRVSSYEQFYTEPDFPDFGGISYPMKLKDIAKFETKNPDISVNVYGVHEWTGRKSKKDVDDEDEYHSEESDSDEMEVDSVSDDKKRGYIYPLRIASKNNIRHVNLLLTDHDGTCHYSTIRNFGGFMLRQYSKNTNRRFFCYTCLHGFKAKKGEKTRDQCKILQEHVKICRTLTPQRVSYPKDEYAEFTNIRKMVKSPVVAYCDIESILVPVSDVDTSLSAGPHPAKKPKHAKYQQHQAASYFTKVVSIDPNFKLEEKKGFQFPQIEPYIGKDAVEHFLDYMTEVSNQTHAKLFDNPAEMIFSEDDKRIYDDSENCHICEKRYSSLKLVHHAHREFDDISQCQMCVKNNKINSMAFSNHSAVHHCHNEGETEKNCSMCKSNDDIKVRDHCHIRGTFRGAAHQSCNLQYNIKASSWKMPVFFHNLRGYDGHMLVKALKRRHGNVRIIPTNLDKYMSIQVGRLLFLDSLQFTLQSLDNLVGTLNPTDFKFTTDFWGLGDDRRTWPHCHREHDNVLECEMCQVNKREEIFRAVTQKGVFFYDYFDDISRLKEKSLPEKHHFFNKLDDKKCSDADYERAKDVWQTFNCQTLKDYHNLYLVSDVLLLADFFEKFRNMCMDFYGLEACHYFSAPGLSWDSCLKYTGVKLQLFDNPEMFNFIESNIRGGISQISLRQAKANNPAMGPRYNPEEPLSHLMYYDANNLYGHAMSEPIPTGGFKWLSDKEIDTLNLSELEPDDTVGYILEVDLDVPKEVHDKHSSYPLAPEKLKITSDMLSPFQQKFPDKQKKSTVKLSPNLYSKCKYITHYRNLQFYLEQGLKLKKIHRVLSFAQSRWLESYIAFNTLQRTLTKSNFGKDFFKLLNNSVFGKTQENLRNRINVEIVTDRKTALKRVSKPIIKRSYAIHEDLVVMESYVTKLILNKPIYVGFTVLEISKLWMYSFHYRQMLQWFNDIDLCFTDTDSLLYLIRGQCPYTVMEEHKEWFDNSDYPFDHPLYDVANKKKLGLMKDELFSLCLEEFIGLRPKCYSLLFNGQVKNNKVINYDQAEKQIAKGTKKMVKKRYIRHEHYRDVVTNLSQLYVKQNSIRSIQHDIGTFHQTRVALTAYDTKRWIEDDGIHTLAYGHYKCNG